MCVCECVFVCAVTIGVARFQISQEKIMSHREFKNNTKAHLNTGTQEDIS